MHCSERVIPRDLFCQGSEMMMAYSASPSRRLFLIRRAIPRNLCWSPILASATRATSSSGLTLQKRCARSGVAEKGDRKRSQRDFGEQLLTKSVHRAISLGLISRSRTGILSTDSVSFVRWRAMESVMALRRRTP